jgi:hypothetical protein
MIVAALSPTPTPAGSMAVSGSAAQIPPPVPQPSVKEYFIPFGTGTNQSSDWTDVPGAQATVDFGGFSPIHKILFEATISIPTANQTASVRLYNVTDKHPVWYSEMTMTNNVYTVSPPLLYDPGAKTYQVQMKTQLQYTANLSLARIHILLK